MLGLGGGYMDNKYTLRVSIYGQLKKGETHVVDIGIIISLNI